MEGGGTQFDWTKFGKFPGFMEQDYADLLKLSETSEVLLRSLLKLNKVRAKLFRDVGSWHLGLPSHKSYASKNSSI